MPETLTGPHTPEGVWSFFGLGGGIQMSSGERGEAGTGENPPRFVHQEICAMQEFARTHCASGVCYVYAVHRFLKMYAMLTLMVPTLIFFAKIINSAHKVLFYCKKKKRKKLSIFSCIPSAKMVSAKEKNISSYFGCCQKKFAKTKLKTPTWKICIPQNNGTVSTPWGLRVQGGCAHKPGSRSVH